MESYLGPSAINICTYSHSYSYLSTYHHEIGVDPAVEHRPGEEGPCPQLPPRALPAVHAISHGQNGRQLSKERRQRQGQE